MELQSIRSPRTRRTKLARLLRARGIDYTKFSPVFLFNDAHSWTTNPEVECRPLGRLTNLPFAPVLVSRILSHSVDLRRIVNDLTTNETISWSIKAGSNLWSSTD